MGSLSTNNESIYTRLKYLQNCNNKILEIFVNLKICLVFLAMGAVPSPFDCFLVNRGLKTLAIRMEQHERNALRIAKFLESHPLIRKVIYPGLESHPGHLIAKHQCTGFGGMVSFYIEGTFQTARAFISNLKIPLLAESLGAVESLIEIPSVMTHASLPAEVRAELGIDDTLIRLSVGIENVDDMIKDLDQALCKSKQI